MTASPVPSAPLGYYFGDDLYGIERAADDLGRRAARDRSHGQPFERWRASGGTTTVGLIGERVATGTMFGGGTLALVTDPAPLIRSRATREALAAVLATVAPGNALAILDPLDRFPKDGRLTGERAALAALVEAAGGEVRGLPAPNAGGMARWIEDRARERDVRLGRGAAQALAERVGAFVREGDVDRRQQGQLAVAELDKLALYRLDHEVTPEDVRALVAEAVPASTWALLDAVAWRRTRDAAELLERILEAVPQPVVVVQLHRRIRELIEVADRIETGSRPSELPRALGIHPFRAETLTKQAAAWTLPELELALGGLLDVDATIKGARRGRSGEGAGRLAFLLWLAQRVAPR